MPTAKSSRLLSIGDFAAATQLSPKALRLYDEQRLLIPASVDALSGYRYYATAQITAGRQIRMLRDMNLSLAQIGTLLAAPGGQPENLLLEWALDADRRYAREKRAFQAALASLRQSTSVAAPEVIEAHRPATTLCVWPFLVERQRFADVSQAQLARAREVMRAAHLAHAGGVRCSLVDPLTEEEGRAELMIAVTTPREIPIGLTLRHSPASRCAVVKTPMGATAMSGLTVVLDAVFDWLDQRGCQATEPPSVSLDDPQTSVEIQWAFEPCAAGAR